jgi:hypothetical protein
MDKGCPSPLTVWGGVWKPGIIDGGREARRMTTTAKRLGILVGGGPAPGINSVISSVTIEAVNSGLEVTGITTALST